MDLRSAVVRLLPPERTLESLTECRHCGTNLDATADRCPACGRSEISSYDLGCG